MLFMNPIRCKLLRGAPAYFKSFGFIIFLVQDLRVGDATAHLDDLNSMGLSGPSGSKGQFATLDCQRKGDCSYYKGQCRQQTFVVT